MAFARENLLNDKERLLSIAKQFEKKIEESCGYYTCVFIPLPKDQDKLKVSWLGGKTYFWHGIFLINTSDRVRIILCQFHPETGLIKHSENHILKWEWCKYTQPILVGNQLAFLARPSGNSGKRYSLFMLDICMDSLSNKKLDAFQWLVNEPNCMKIWPIGMRGCFYFEPNPIEYKADREEGEMDLGRRLWMCRNTVDGDYLSQHMMRTNGELPRAQRSFKQIVSITHEINKIAFYDRGIRIEESTGEVFYFRRDEQVRVFDPYTYTDQEAIYPEDRAKLLALYERDHNQFVCWFNLVGKGKTHEREEKDELTEIYSEHRIVLRLRLQSLIPTRGETLLANRFLKDALFDTNILPRAVLPIVAEYGSLRTREYRREFGGKRLIAATYPPAHYHLFHLLPPPCRPPVSLSSQPEVKAMKVDIDRLLDQQRKFLKEQKVESPKQQDILDLLMLIKTKFTDSLVESYGQIVDGIRKNLMGQRESAAITRRPPAAAAAAPAAPAAPPLAEEGAVTMKEIEDLLDRMIKLPPPSPVIEEAPRPKA